MNDVSDALRAAGKNLVSAADAMDGITTIPNPRIVSVNDPLTVTLTLDDNTKISFAEKDGISRGTLLDRTISTYFTFIEINKYPWIVTIIRGGSVPDVVLSYGGSSTDTLASAVSYQKPYIFEVSSDSGFNQKENVPYHTWGTTICMSLGTPNVLKTNTDLINNRLVPPFTSNISPKAGAPLAAPYATMGTSSISIYWPTTGDRPEIGLLTEWDAYYIATGKGLNAVLDTGEAIGSYPHHLTINGLPLNLEQNPKLLTYSSFNPYSVPSIPLGDGWTPAGINSFTMDIAHHPHMGYLAYQLTRRPYLLRRFQDQTTWLQAWSPMNGHTIGGDGQQVRADAWILQSKLLCYLASPLAADCPAYLLSKEYWKRQLDADGAWFDKNMMNPCDNVLPTGGDGYYHWGPNTKNQRFHSATAVMETSFKEDYLGAVMGFMAWVSDNPAYKADLGLWKTRFAWKVQFPIDRSSGLTAWDQHYPDMYYIKAYKFNGVPTFDGPTIQNNLNTPALTVCTDMADLWASNKDDFKSQWTSLTNPAFPNGPKYRGDLALNGQCYIRMQFIFAKACGLSNSGLKEAYDWLVPMVIAPEYRLGLAT